MALLWSPDRYSAQLLLHLPPLLPALLCFIPQGSFVWAKTFLPFQRRENVVAQVGLDGGRRARSGEWDCCNTLSIIHAQLWMTLAKPHKLFAGNQPAEPSLLSERSVWFQVIKSCPGKSNSDACLFFTLFLREWWVHKCFISCSDML